MTEFVNPYNFVGSEYDENKTDSPLPHDRIHLEQYSGRLECSLLTLKRVTTKSLDPRSEGLIYGSSLKGVIRSMAEAIARGCYTLSDETCRSADHLCICCRMFGWMQRRGSELHLGRINIGDALPPTGNWRETSATYIEHQALSSHGERHRPFYYLGGKRRGRKFYYHHSPEHDEQKTTHSSENHRGKKNEPITVAKSNITFTFKVDFTDLTRAELGLLLYALQLEPGLFHKIGKGKPLGFGTVEIRVESISLLPPNRYQNLAARLTPVEEFSSADPGLQFLQANDGEGVTAGWDVMGAEQRRSHFAEMLIDHFFRAHFGKPYAQRFDGSLPHMLDLRHMLSLHQDYPLRYPSDQWFKTYPLKPLPTLEEIEEGESKPPGQRKTWLKE